MAEALPENIFVSRHPLVAHKISLLRDKTVPPKQFRELVDEISVLLGYEATWELETVEAEELQGHLQTVRRIKLKDRVGLFPILRAGLGMVNGFLNLIPSAKVLHLGLFREKFTLQPVEYYNKLPQEPCVDQCIILDPMIATAGTAIATVNILKDWGATRIKFVCLCASLQGIQALHQAHPDIAIHVGVVDSEVNSEGYIVPGFGDAGDRLNG